MPAKRGKQRLAMTAALASALGGLGVYVGVRRFRMPDR
ncbi:hypothetical protein PXO_00759 [Xanthomonas oryzae pv. oryzae PXO99A]|uniref:Uncharacterized protein n=1 Tax=Xanthomonas oryzae pv. oryzae (strain PXO99A) TaxID=360094 RepID=A0A0K0GKI0_XANOP|nr:hypothetical protein PXO_00759 [Xanthomonas oryzae pv. oryzae PXO99A]